MKVRKGQSQPEIVAAAFEFFTLFWVDHFSLYVDVALNKVADLLFLPLTSKKCVSRVGLFSSPISPVVSYRVERSGLLHVGETFARTRKATGQESKVGMVLVGNHFAFLLLVVYWDIPTELQKVKFVLPFQRQPSRN